MGIVRGYSFSFSWENDKNSAEVVFSASICVAYASRQASLAEALAESSGVESPYSLFQKAESKDVIP